MANPKPLEVLIIGAGSRGMYAYGEFSKKEDVNVEVVAVAEPIDERREKMRFEHNIPPSRCFRTAEEALALPKFCDAVINATPDKAHYDISIAALKKGYHLILEKPMATSPEECVDIFRAEKKAKKVLSVAHVLRYAPFFQKIKELVDSGEYGRVIDINLLEEVGYWHFAHSYVRGNWRKKNESGPIVLTKSCHDLDILSWLVGNPVKSIYSTGSLKFFKRKNAPEGSTERCTDDCKAKKGCPYNAEEFYLSEKDPREVKWPINVISPVDKSVDARKKVLETGIYGRCVYRCDNDVCDNQEIYIRFQNGINARFILSAFGQAPTRKIRIYCDKGEIHGDLAQGSIKLVKYSGKRGADYFSNMEITAKGGHGGGDELLLKSFARAVGEKDAKSNLSTAEKSLDSHLMAFAAEESRLRGKPVNYQAYKKKLGL